MVVNIEQSGNTIIAALVTLAAVTIAGVLAAAIFVSGETTAVIAAIIGVSSPIMLGLLGVLINSLILHVNSKMTEFMDLVRTAAFAEGQKEERDRDA